MDFYKVLFAQKHGLASGFLETLLGKATAVSELPEGYKKVKSLTMDNDCYYEITDFYLKGSDTIKFACSITNACNIIGAYSGSGSGANYSVYGTTIGGSYLRYYSGTYNSKFVANKRYDITLTPTGSHGMDIESTWDELEFTSTRQFCIGTTAANITTSARMRGTFYGNIIVEDTDGLRFKGIPCVREADDVPGYYDVVSETFYEPIGTNPTYTE